MRNKILAILGALLVAFLIGFVPQYLNVRALRVELESTQSRLEDRASTAESESRLWHLNAELGLLLLEVQDQNYGTAREHSTAWFDEAAAIERTTDDASLSSTLSELIGRRDRVTSLLTEGNADSGSEIRDMYRTLARALEP